MTSNSGVPLTRAKPNWNAVSSYSSNSFLAEPAREIGPIPLVKGGRVKALQNLRYTSYARLKLAKTMDDLWGETADAAAHS